MWCASIILTCTFICCTLARILCFAAAYSLEDIHNSSGAHITRENFNAVVSQFDLYDTYFPHFQAGVSPVAQGGGAAAGVMMAMNELNGIPCTADPFLINATLFTAWGMQGYITSDGGDMVRRSIYCWFCIISLF
jgi:hypothetical protein